MEGYETWTLSQLKYEYSRLKRESAKAWREIGGRLADDYDQNAVINAYAPELAELNDEITRRNGWSN